MPRTRSQTTDGVKISPHTHFSTRIRTSKTTIKNLAANANSANANLSSKKMKNNKGLAVNSTNASCNSDLAFEKLSRSRNSDSASSTISATSTLTNSTSSSSKENETPVNLQSAQKKVENPIEIAPSVSTQVLTARQPLAQKRKRPVQKESEPFDFSNSPISGQKAVEKLTNVSKRQKISASPRNKNEKEQLAKKESDGEGLVELISKVPEQKELKVIEVAKPVVMEEPKKLTMKERIAKIKEQKMQAAQNIVPEQQAETLTPVPVPEPKKLSMKERIAKIKQQKAEQAAKIKQKNETENTSTTGPSQHMSTSTPKNSEKSTKIAKIKENLAKSKLERLNDQQKSKNLINQVEQAKKDKEEYVKLWLEEKINAIQTSIFRNFTLPNTFKKLKKHFQCLDEVLMTLNNRKETVAISRVERDVSRYNGSESFKKEHLRKIMFVRPESYFLEWKRGLRIEDSVTESNRIKSDSYQLTIKPNLTDNNSALNDTDQLGLRTPTKPNIKNSAPPQQSWIRMTVKHLHNRIEDFTKRLYLATNLVHSKYLHNKPEFNKKYSLEEIKEKFSLENGKLKNWDVGFQKALENGTIDPVLALADLPLNPASDSLFSTPNSICSSSNGSRLEPSTPMSARRLLNQFCEKERQKERVAQNSIDSGCSFDDQNGPNGQNLNPLAEAQSKLRQELEQKYRSQGMSERLIQKNIKRRLKEQENDMFKEKLNNVKKVQELKSLYDIARGIKSYFTVTKSCSGTLSEIVGSLMKNSAISLNFNDVKDRIDKLVNLEPIKAVECLKYEEAPDGQKYVKMKPKTTLVSFNNAIKLTLERVDRD